MPKNRTCTLRQSANGAYHSAIVNDTGIPANANFYGAARRKPYDLTVLVGIYGIGLAASLPGTKAKPIPGVSNVKYGAPFAMSTAPQEADVASDIQHLQQAQRPKVSTPDLVYLDSRKP